MRGRKPKPTMVRRAEGNPGKRGFNPREPVVPVGLPSRPPHLTELAGQEWDRLAGPLHDIGVVTLVDRAALAAYCQAYGRWVEAEQKLQETPMLLKTPSGYIQQSPWLSIANKQMELMGRFMSELGLTPAARSRVAAMHHSPGDAVTPVTRIERIIVCPPDTGRTAAASREDDAIRGSSDPGAGDVDLMVRRG